MATSSFQAFKGRDLFIDGLDQAMQAGDEHAVVEAMRKQMCAFIRSPDIDLPADVYDPVEGHYARRSLYHSKEHDYEVIVMTWGPDQGTPIHDHSGMWCVEGVWHGELEIVQYEIAEKKDELYRFEQADAIQACIGSAGCLIPPHEYHTIHNRHPENIAISVHVYQHPMMSSHVFMPDDEHADWNQRVLKHLALDS